MLSRELARRYGKEGIVSLAQNPGNLRAGGYDDISALTKYHVLHRTPLARTRVRRLYKVVCGLIVGYYARE